MIWTHLYGFKAQFPPTPAPLHYTEQKIYLGRLCYRIFENRIILEIKDFWLLKVFFEIL